MRSGTPHPDKEGGSLLALLGRHQLAALAATAADFVLMIAAVELAGMNPVGATALGAGCGAITNFLLARHLVFAAGDSAWSGQATRYALVATGSLILNTLGEHLAYGSLGLPYLPARLVVALIVGVAWNFQLHRRFVFARTSQARAI